jgi:hypothetical protein
MKHFTPPKKPYRIKKTQGFTLRLFTTSVITKVTILRHHHSSHMIRYVSWLATSYTVGVKKLLSRQHRLCIFTYIANSNGGITQEYAYMRIQVIDTTKKVVVVDCKILVRRKLAFFAINRR